MRTPDAHGPTRKHGEILTEISNGLVALFKDYYGIGPTQAKTYYHDDVVVCVMRRGLTRAEQTLLAGNRGQVVIEQWMAFQEVMRERFEGVVQRATGRRVIGFMSGSQQDPEMICEVFVLNHGDPLTEEERRAAGDAISNDRSLGA